MRFDYLSLSLGKNVRLKRDAKLLRNGLGCSGVVARDHDDLEACAGEFTNRLRG